MLAPTEKSNDTIQVVVTRACDLHWCSNCTQLIPLRKDAMHMSLDVFRRAVESVRDWPGVIGIFGGNPCAHPEFDALCEILRELVPEQHRRGLWTNNFLGHGPVVRQTFYPRGRFNLNAHGSRQAAADMERWCPGKVIAKSPIRESMHSAILVDRRDLGIEDAAWVEARERCDINRNWSASIMERDGAPVAYFCEVAGAIDAVRGTNHGIPAVPGWWRSGMDVFAQQVSGCCDDGCGVPLRLLGHLDSDQTYDVSERWAATVQPRGKMRTHLITPSVKEEKCDEATDYMRLRAKEEP